LEKFFVFCFLFSVFLFDVTLLFTYDSILTPLSLLNDCSSALCNWLMFNGLRLNPSKSEVMWFGTRAQLRSAPQDDILISSQPVSSSNSVKVVGVTFDSQLAFSQHISQVCKEVNFHLLALRHIRRYIDTPTANMLATSIIQSRLDYCNSLFSGLSESNLCRLQRVQNRAALIVTNSRGPVSCSALLRKLHWLPIPNRIDFKIALLTFKVLLTSQQPIHLNSLLHPYSASRSLRSSELQLLSVPPTKSVIQSRAFSSYSPQLWNRLPQSIRNLAFSQPLPIANPAACMSNSVIYPNLSPFKTALKTFLFDLLPTSLVP